MKELDIKEFYEKGYLQELNRLFLHPLGLVLTIKLNKNTGKLELDKILDYRDREVKFSKEGLDRQRYEHIKKEWEDRAVLRQKALGFIIQPIK